MSKAKFVKVENQQELEKVLEIIGNPLNTTINGDEYNKKYDVYVVVDSELENYRCGLIVKSTLIGNHSFKKYVDVIIYKEFISQNNIKADNPQEAKPKTKKSKYKKAFKKLQKEYNELLNVNKKLGSKLKCHKEFISALEKYIEYNEVVKDSFIDSLDKSKEKCNALMLERDELLKKIQCLEFLRNSTIPPIEKITEIFSKKSLFGQLLHNPPQREPIKFDGSKTMKNHTEVFYKIKEDYNMEKWEASHDTLANTVEVTFFKKL